MHTLLVGVLCIGTEHTIVGHRAGRVHPHHRFRGGPLTVEGPSEACHRSVRTLTLEDHVLLDGANVACSLIKADRLLDLVAFRHESKERNKW